jgi:hypothetical protein
MASPDNKMLKVRCTKLLKGEATLDLIPRSRYLLDLVQDAPSFVPSARLLFDLGLHIAPVLKPGTQVVTSVVAINLSDKVVRLHNGMCLTDDGYQPAQAEGTGNPVAETLPLPEDNGS